MKRLAMLIATLALVMSLAACGCTDKNATNSGTTPGGGSSGGTGTTQNGGSGGGSQNGGGSGVHEPLLGVTVEADDIEEFFLDGILLQHRVIQGSAEFFHEGGLAGSRHACQNNQIHLLPLTAER